MIPVVIQATSTPSRAASGATDTLAVGALTGTITSVIVVVHLHPLAGLPFSVVVVSAPAGSVAGTTTCFTMGAATSAHACSARALSRASTFRLVARTSSPWEPPQLAPLLP